MLLRPSSPAVTERSSQMCSAALSALWGPQIGSAVAERAAYRFDYLSLSLPFGPIEWISHFSIRCIHSHFVSGAAEIFEYVLVERGAVTVESKLKS